MVRNLELRRKSYARLSAQIASMESDHPNISGAQTAEPTAWGRTEVLKVGRSSVFVKRIPVTDVELASQFSTRNLYDLPSKFNYGIGSFGLCVFRELAACVKSNHWVLSGAWPFFPLTYHYRIVPRPTGGTAAEPTSVSQFAQYWGGDASIARYETDRLNARHELVLFQEHFPHTLDPWLRENPGRTAQTMKKLFATVGFLREQGVIHFDAHFQNVVTDGVNPYLTDFGLALDREFTFSPKEKVFFREHTDYDFARLISCLAFHLDDRYRALSQAAQHDLKQRYGLAPDATERQTIRALAEMAEDLPPDLNLAGGYAETLKKYGGIYELMQSFSASLIESPSKDLPFPHASLRQLLSSAGLT